MVSGNPENMAGICHSGIPTGVHVVFEQYDRLLLMRRAGTGFFDGLYSLPGGHVEAGESVFQTAVREVREELGMVVAVADLDWLGVVHRASDTNRIDFFVRAVAWQGSPMIAEPSKCDRLEWFPRVRLPDNMVPYICRALEQRDIPWILELGWP